MRRLGSDRADLQRGFTLLEMMITLLIIGIATAAASVSALGDSQARVLRQDAQRLSQLFIEAQTEARAGGRRIVWRPAAQGYVFERQPRSLVLPARIAARSARGQDDQFSAESPLRPRAWSSAQPVTVTLQPMATLVFDADWIHDPLEIVLSSGDQTVRLSRLGNGRYEVRP